MIDAKIFFDHVRASLFGGKLTQSQVDNMLAMIKEYEHRKWTDLRWLAYIMGTAYHEDGIIVKQGTKKVLFRSMAPVEEMGKGKGRGYGSKVRFDGKPYINPDHIFYGRGHTQNTWYENYEKLTIAAKKEGKPWDFLNYPEFLLEIEPSIWATFHAMSTGLYTGKKLSNYFNDEIEDWDNARRIINKLDNAKFIAGIAKEFYEALKQSINNL